MQTADVSVTLSLNGLTGAPWGVQSDGGSEAFTTPTADNLAFGTELLNQVHAFTGRPGAAVNAGPTNGTHYPYPEFAALPGTYAQIFMLYLDHNFDAPIVLTRPDLLVSAIVTGLAKTLQAKGFQCLGKFPSLPTAAELQRLRNLGFQNFQRYGADPVSFSTGNFATAEKVFTLSGVGQQTIDLSLTYNAQSGQDSPVGVGWEFAYAAFLQQYADGSVVVNMADGRAFLFPPDGHGGFTTPGGAFATLTQPTATTFKLASTTGTSMTFIQDPSGRAALSAMSDRQGNTITLAYSGAGTIFPSLAGIVDQAGQHIAVSADGNGRITSFARPDGAVWRLGYSPAGDLTSITSALGTVRHFGYDSQHRMTSEVGQDGVTFLTNTYDAQSRVVGQTNAFGQPRSISYDDANQATTYTDTTGAKTVYHWNSIGAITEVDDPLGGVTKTVYNTNFQPVTQTDPLNHSTAATYDTSGKVASATDPLGATTTSTYNAAGDLTSSTDAGGTAGAPRTFSYTVNGAGLPTTITNPDGSTQTRSYNSFGDVTAATDENGAVTTFGYDERGNTTAVTDPLGRVTTMTYDLANRLTSATDPSGHKTSYAYDADDNLTKTTFPNGSSEQRSYDVNDQLVSKIDQRGGHTTYGYDAQLNVTRVTLPNGGVITNTFDHEDRQTSVTDALGDKTTYTLDALGRRVATTDARGNTTHTTFDAAGQVAAQTDAVGATTTFARDADGRLLSVTDPAGGVGTQTWDPVGRLIAKTDQLAHRTSYAYNFRDQQTSVTDPAGGVTAHTYDRAGQLVSDTDPAGATTTYLLDAAGQTVKKTDAIGGVWTYTYDPAGNQTGVTDPNGHTTKAAYDAMNKPVGATDGNGNTSVTQRDPGELVTAEIDALGHRTNHTYNVMGDLAATTDPLGRTTTFGYDLAGRQTTQTAPDGVTTADQYDPVANLVAVTQNARPGQPATATVNVTTGHGYDARNLLTSTTDANGGTTTDAYDTLGRLTAATNQIGKVVHYSYDKASNLATRTDANGATTTYSYDPRNLLTKKAYPDASTNTFTYDADGRQLTATSPAGTVTTAYDPLGRANAVTDANGKKLAYSYDGAGNRSRVTLPDARTLTYSYDAADQLTALNSPLGALSTAYDAAGKPSKVTRPNGTVTTVGFDAANQLTALTTTGRAGVVASFNYTYDAAGNVATRTQNLGRRDQTPTAYSYDPLRRLTASVGGPLPSTYSYDAVGNRVAWNAPDDTSTVIPSDALAQTNTYNPAGELTQTVAVHTIATASSSTTLQTDTTTNTYDNNGNRILASDTAQPGFTSRSAFKYDFENRLVASGPANNTGGVCGWPGDALDGCIPNFNGDLATLAFPSDWYRRTQTRTYDALGRVTSEKSGPTTTAFTDDGLNPILATDTRTTLYLRDGTGQLVGEQNEQPETEWYITDALGSIMGATNKAGNLDGQPTTYSDYGQALTRVNFRYGYNGQETDAHGSGPTNFYARTYDPTTATWIQPDPYKGNPQQPDTLNRYHYTADNPTTNTDRLGYFSISGFVSGVSAFLNLVVKFVVDPIGSAITTVINGVTALLRKAPSAMKQAPSTLRHPGRSPMAYEHLSDAGLAFLAANEGSSSKLYDDSQGNCTIGVGHLVHPHPCNGSEPPNFKKMEGLSNDEVLDLFRQDVGTRESAVSKAVTSPITQYQFDALVSFTYNVGIGAFQGSDVLKLVNQKKYSEVPDELLTWGPAEDRSRREREAALFGTGKY